MFPVSSNNLVPVCGSQAVNSIQVQMYGPRHSSPDPQFSFNSPRPPNVGPILGNQMTVPPPPIGPNMRLFPPPVTAIPWGSGAFQGYPRPPIPAPITPQPQMPVMFPNSTNPLNQFPIGPNLHQVGSVNCDLNQDPTRSLGQQRSMDREVKDGHYREESSDSQPKRKHSRWDGNEGGQGQGRVITDVQLDRNVEKCHEHPDPHSNLNDLHINNRSRSLEHRDDLTKGHENLHKTRQGQERRHRHSGHDSKHHSKTGAKLIDDREDKHYGDRKHRSHERSFTSTDRNEKHFHGNKSAERNDHHSDRRHRHSKGAIRVDDGGNRYSDQNDSREWLGDSVSADECERGRYLDDSRGLGYDGRSSNGVDRSQEYDSAGSQETFRGYKYESRKSVGRGGSKYERGSSKYERFDSDRNKRNSHPRERREDEGRERGTILREDRVRGAVLKDDRIKGAILREDRMDTSQGKRAVLRDDREDNRGERGSVLREDRIRGAILREDRVDKSRREGAVLRDDRGKGAVLREDRVDKSRREGAVLRDDRGRGAILREDRMDIRQGREAILREDRGREAVLREDRVDNTNRRGTVLRDDREERPILREDRVREDRRRGTILREDRIDRNERGGTGLREDRRRGAELREDTVNEIQVRGAVLRDDREKGPVLREDREKGPVLREDRINGRRAVLRDDRVGDSRGKRAVPRDRDDMTIGGFLRDDRLDEVGGRGAVLRDDTDRETVLREDNVDKSRRKGAVLREDRVNKNRDQGAVVREDRVDEKSGKGATNTKTSHRGNIISKDSTEERTSDFHSVDVGGDRHSRECGNDNSKNTGMTQSEPGKGIGEIVTDQQNVKENQGTDHKDIKEVNYGQSSVKIDRKDEVILDRRRDNRPILREDRDAKVTEKGSNKALIGDRKGHEGRSSTNKGRQSAVRGVRGQGHSGPDKGRMSFEGRDRDRKRKSSGDVNHQSVARGNRGQGDSGSGDKLKGYNDRGRFHGDRGQSEVVRDQHYMESGYDQATRGNSRERRERSSSLQRPFSGSGVNKRMRSESETEDLLLDEPHRFKRQRLEDLVEDPQNQCVRSGSPIVPVDDTETLYEESVAAWVRCSAADLYFRKDPKTGNLAATKRMQDLEKRFGHDLVQRAAQIKGTQVPYEKPLRKPKLSFKHKCKAQPAQCPGKKCGKSTTSSSPSSSDTDDDTDSGEDEEEEWWMEAVRHKEGNPYRMHKDLWYNEHGELNYGPLCRCSVKCKKFGIRHDIYPGEKPLPKCPGTSNNMDKLFHYKISVSPVTNFLTKHPTIINFDGHEYMFEGFSIFSHFPIPKLPPCQVIRFNIVYTIHIIEEPAPENFSVESLDLFADFLFSEILELVDIDWKGPGGDEHCRRFHMMPRFARPFPENGKEVLSMNDVFLYLIKSSKQIIEPRELASLVKLDYDRWQHFVDGFRHMVVTKPGMRPSSIRIDQLDKQNCNTDEKLTYPLIIHHGNRPAQLSYAGDNTYRKKWKEYLKFKHLLWSRTKVTPKDKDKLDELEAELHKIRSKYTMKKEVSIEISSEGFLLTGIRSDICQHAMMLPVLFNHVRFHASITEFEKGIGYTFKDKSLIQLALTHASYKVNYGTNPDHGRNSMYNCGSRHVELGDIKIHHQHTRKRGLNILLRIMSKMAKKQEERSEIPHNERLEFLGDAVVEFITSIHLFYMFQQADEGELTMYRGALVRNAHFSILAEKLGLHEYLLYAHGTDLCHEGDLKHAMANCFEALLGALYLDGGIQVADRVFTNALFNEEDLLDIWKNLPKHQLQGEEPDGDRHWIKNSPALKKLVNFENDIGYEFYHIRLLAKAYTQRSVGYNRLTHGHNQRLEFLGDTVMQLISSDYLFRHFPDHHEGHLTLLRSSLVNNKTQACVADDLGMTNYVLKSRHDDLSQLKQKEKADLLEALLGAMYVDGGIQPCTTLCNVCFFPKLETFILNQDWNDPKSQLQQSCLTLRDTSDEYPDIPVYKVLNASGPTNTRTFKVAVYFRGKRLAVGEGRSIQQGEMNAADLALKKNKGMFNIKLRARMGMQ